MRTFKKGQIIVCGKNVFKVIERENGFYYHTLFLRDVNDNQHPFYMHRIAMYRDGNEYVKIRIKSTNRLTLIRA